jgi:hypothetical protein
MPEMKTMMNLIVVRSHMAGRLALNWIFAVHIVYYHHVSLTNHLAGWEVLLLVALVMQPKDLNYTKNFGLSLINMEYGTILNKGYASVRKLPSKMATSLR